MLKYDAIGLAAKDLASGKNLFNKKEFTPLPFVSCNIKTDTQQKIFPSYRIKNISGMRIGIIGVTGGKLPNNSQFILGNWRDSLQKEIPVLQKKSDMIIALSTMKMEKNLILAKEFPQINLIVSSCEEYGNTVKILDPKQHTPLLVQVAGEGSMLGQLQILWNKKAAKGWRELPDENVEQLKKKLIAKQKHLTVLNEKNAQTADKKEEILRYINRDKRTINRLQSRLDFLNNTKKAIEREEINGFTARFRKVYPKTGSQEIIRLVEEAVKEIKNNSSH